MWKAFLAGLFVCASLGAGSADAVSFETRDFDALAREADQVVVGTMVAKDSRRTGEREIVTDYRFDDLKVVKGNVNGLTLTLTMLGGTVGTESLVIAGAPTFNRGSRYLLFVSGNGSVMFPLVGGNQGIFQMRKDEASGVTRVRDHAGRPVTRLPGLAGRNIDVDAGADAGETVTETAFIDAIRSRNATARAGVEK
ncbi:MAG: hypothetical protein ABI790_12790 [Betaproteobacteria bacterium]